MEAVPAEDRRTHYCDPEAWKHGGGSVWVTGSYDPDAQPDVLGRRQRRARLEQRAASRRQPLHRLGRRARRRHRPAASGTTSSRRTIDYDYDSVQVPVLADITWRGAPLKAMVWANRNGNFYVLDRETGKFLVGKPFVKVNWMDTFDERGRPHQTPQPPGQPTWPGNQGGTNWYSPSYSPHTGLFYVSGVGRLRHDLRRHAGRVSGRAELWRRRQPAARAGSRRAGSSRDPARSDQQLDRSGGHRRGARARRRPPAS